MSAKLFEAGEEVYVLSGSTGNQEETVIIEIIKGPIRVNFKDGTTLGVVDLAYRLDGGYKGVSTVITTQDKLRKKPKPSEYKFDDLIKEINDLVTV